MSSEKIAGPSNNTNDSSTNHINKKSENKNNPQMELSNKLLIKNVQESDSGESDDDDDDDDDSPQMPDDIPSWQQTIINSFFNILVEESPILTRQRSQQDSNKLRRKSSYKQKILSDPSEKQLSAPYVEEVQPEQPDYMRHPSVGPIGQSSDIALSGTSQRN